MCPVHRSRDILTGSSDSTMGSRSHARKQIELENVVDRLKSLSVVGSCLKLGLSINTTFMSMLEYRNEDTSVLLTAVTKGLIITTHFCLFLLSTECKLYFIYVTLIIMNVGMPLTIQ